MRRRRRCTRRRRRARSRPPPVRAAGAAPPASRRRRRPPCSPRPRRRVAARRVRTDPATVRRPPPPSGSSSHSAPTFASRVPARPPSLPARPSVSDRRAGTPVPSSATHRTSPAFGGLRAGASRPPGTATDRAPDSAARRRDSTSSPTERVVRSMPCRLRRAFAPKFTSASSSSSLSASP